MCKILFLGIIKKNLVHKKKYKIFQSWLFTANLATNKSPSRYLQNAEKQFFVCFFTNKILFFLTLPLPPGQR